jgi:hypothetical protein
MDIEHGPDVGFIPATNSSDAIDTSPNSTSVNYRLWFSYTNQFETELMNVRKTNCTLLQQSIKSKGVQWTEGKATQMFKKCRERVGKEIFLTNPNPATWQKVIKPRPLF